jgi:hypothetical protein
MGHKHTFKPSAHLDGCHYFIDVAVCACGATFAQEGERNPSRDPYATIWFTEDCERCQAILGGADVRYNYRQAGPKGRTVRQDESHVAQEAR